MARKQPRPVARPASLLDEVEDKPKAKASTPEAETVIEVAMKRWLRADAADQENRRLAYEDLEFLEEPGAQWTREAKAARKHRPCLEFNRLPTTISQITGDIRQMKPAVKVVPVDDRGDPDTADVIAGMVRYVENRSDAPAAYFAAADQQVAAGIGHWKVIREYGSDSTFEQEIRVTGIPDGIGVRWDPDAILPTREDAKFCFVPMDMSRDAYEEAYPDQPAAEVGDADLHRSGLGEWSTADVVRVAEYFVKTPVRKTLALMPDGEIVDLTDKDADDYPEKLALAQAVGARIEQRPGHKVERYVISATDVLEGPEDCLGRFIPVIPCLGIETQIGKRRLRRGIVRNAKDAQRAYNYARSTQTEVVALQPKAPFIATVDQIKGYEGIWETANNEAHPFLPYNPDPKANGVPQRVSPPVASAGLAELTREAAEDIKAVTGVYDASLGARSNETSGKAIRARQQEGDVGSFGFIVNFARAIRHTGSVIVDLIPHVYDTARTIRIVGEDGKVDRVQINQPHGLADEDQPLERIKNDVTVGAYDVAMEMGPSYTTRREAALDGMTSLLQAAPQLAPTMIDLFAKAQDWPMADQIAKRAKVLLPPAIQQAEAAENGEPPPPPSPQEIQQQQAQERQQQLAEQQHQLEVGRLQVEQQKLQAEMAKVDASLQQAQIEQQTRAIEVAHPAAPDGAAPAAADPRIDAIGQAVEHLGDVVSMIMEAMGGGDAPPAAEPGPPQPDQPPPGLPAPTSDQAPQGAFFIDPSAAPQGPAPTMGQP